LFLSFYSFAHNECLQVVVIRARGGRVLCDGDTTNGCVLAGRARGPHYALRETLNMQVFMPEEQARLAVPSAGEFAPQSAQPTRGGTLLLAAGMWGATFQHFLQDLVDVVGLLWDEVAADASLRILTNCYGYNGPHVKEIIDILGLSDRILCMQVTWSCVVGGFFA
jgi:hypothetical protein